MWAHSILVNLKPKSNNLKYGKRKKKQYGKRKKTIGPNDQLSKSTKDRWGGGLAMCLSQALAL